MTKDTDSNTRETTQPAYYAYSVSEPKRRGQKGRWTRIGAYFAHDDGHGGSARPRRVAAQRSHRPSHAEAGRGRSRPGCGLRRGCI